MKMGNDKPKKYKMTFGKAVTAGCAAIAVLCLFTTAYSAYILISEELDAAATYLHLFLIMLNIGVAVSVLLFLFASFYILAEDCLTVRTGFFRDKLKYDSLTRLIHNGAKQTMAVESTETRLPAMKININKDKLADFAKNLQAKTSIMDYVVTLEKTEIDKKD